ncbi:Gfo/Idh/MocA family oxidoreductase [Saccharomonospora piscinae]|uniref:Gfo/Idh/MocA family protein n=1 Tax=Saccharomonospora piscinae TaxID=687388 RepID=UPI0011059BEC|nr:Gfo/Idh/MocA family oxidoreductase [Saccharomonospora piscinae]TLW90454.1 Gfo/Idh/MocA family oxidoreductase [Saccharomonospora piscinae]
MSPVRIAVVGAGLIGRRHLGLLGADPDCEPAAVVDPDPAARAALPGIPAYAELADMLAVVRPDGVIVASPNRFHAEHVLRCLAHGVPVLVEKPLADSVADGLAMVEAAESAGVPLLVGHHRRHSPLLAAARAVVRRGTLGRLVAVQGTALFRKPDDYFERAPWRARPGGGPILINLIHEIDNLRALCGDITGVQATASGATRGFAVEDTAAITLRFASGALGTFLLSDAAASARSWELTSREDPRFPRHEDEDCYVLAGTDGSLGIPTMRLRVYEGTPSWWEPLRTAVVPVEREDPLARQLTHFRAVIQGRRPPLVDGREGLATLRTTLAVTDAVRTGEQVEIG